MERGNEGPPSRIYNIAEDAYAEWVDSQSEPDDLWQKSREAAKAVVDAIWPYVTLL